jgi:hypothetical protein
VWLPLLEPEPLLLLLLLLQGSRLLQCRHQL